MIDQLTYRLDQFEGPLDLLLTLIQKNKVSITDIPIAMICDQYMEYISEAERLDLEIASEFIVMASELMLIKSKMLLPHEEGTENDPRREIADAILLHMKAKQAAEMLKPMYEEYSGRFVKGTDDIPPEKGRPLNMDPDLLIKALNAVLRGEYHVIRAGICTHGNEHILIGGEAHVVDLDAGLLFKQVKNGFIDVIFPVVNVDLFLCKSKGRQEQRHSQQQSDKLLHNKRPPYCRFIAKANAHAAVGNPNAE